MKIGQKFSNLTLIEYQFYIDNYKKYTDFNSLGLYRSIIENEKLTLAEKLELRAYAHAQFQKTFDFLQLKDPKTFMDVCSLDEELTKADEHQLWENIKVNQQKILKDKKIKHRNFGIYSIHDCGYETCPFNGMMIQQGSRLAESNMHFDSDKNHWAAVSKSERLKRDRKNVKQIIDEELEELD
jgi:hypothetical protein